MSDHFVKSYPQRTQTSNSKTANATCIRDAIPSMVRVGTAAAEDNQFSDSAWTPQSAEVASFPRICLAVCTSVLTCWSIAQMCCTMHPVQLAWAVFAIFLDMPTFNIFQPGVESAPEEDGQHQQ